MARAESESYKRYARLNTLKSLRDCAGLWYHGVTFFVRLDCTQAWCLRRCAWHQARASFKQGTPWIPSSCWHRGACVWWWGWGGGGLHSVLVVSRPTAVGCRQ